MQNLKDAGCNSRMIDIFFSLLSSGENIAALKLLTEHKRQLLECLHKKQKNIDCLDFLIFKMKGMYNE